MTIFFIISGIGQALAGFAVDRIGPRRVLLFGVSMLALSGFTLALAAHYWMLAVSAGLAGLGNSVFHPVDFTILNRRVSPQRLGHAFSVHGLSGNLGWAAAPVFMAGIAALANWHWAGFGAGMLATTVLAVLIWQRDLLGCPREPCACRAGGPDPAAGVGHLRLPAVLGRLAVLQFLLRHHAGPGCAAGLFTGSAEQDLWPVAGGGDLLPDCLPAGWRGGDRRRRLPRRTRRFA